MLGRAMVRFGAPTQTASAAVQAASTNAGPERARLERQASGGYQLVVDDGFDRAWRRVGLALDRVGFTVIDRDRSKGTYFVRYSDPETDGAKKEKGLLDKLMFWKTDTPNIEQYRITIAEATPRSLVTVQDPNGAPDKSATGEKILSLLRDQLK
jgi:outer membrane protein assembly factor BamC